MSKCIDRLVIRWQIEKDKDKKGIKTEKRSEITKNPSVRRHMHEHTVIDTRNWQIIDWIIIKRHSFQLRRFRVLFVPYIFQYHYQDLLLLHFCYYYYYYYDHDHGHHHVHHHDLVF